MLFVSLSSYAQDISEIGTPLITDAEQLSSPHGEDPANEGEFCVPGALIDGDPATYWHTKWAGVAEDFHYLDIAFPEEVSGDIVMYVRRRANQANNHPTVFKVEGSTDGENWALVDTVSLPFTGAGTEATSDPFTIATPVTHLRLTATDCAPAFNVFWHCAELQLYAVGGQNEDAYVQFLLNQILLKYDGHLVEDQFTFSEEVGDYTDRASYEVFKEKVRWVEQFMAGQLSETVTVEQAMAIIDEIEALYQAVLDSKVAMPPFASGYYFIKGALDYTNTIRTPILDEDGNPMLNEDGEEMYDETVTHPVMAMYVANGNLKWKSLDENKDATFLFKLTYRPETGNYDLMSCANDGRIATVAQSAAVTVDPALPDSVDNDVKISYSRKDETKGLIVSICRADQGETYTYLHMGGHGGGTGQGGDIVGWENSAEASLWYLAPVDEAEAAAMIEEYAPIRDRDAMLTSVSSMVSEGKEALAVAEDVITTIDTENPLVTDANSQFSSPYTNPDEQADADGNKYTADNVYVLLLDGKDNTYWHSDWSSTVATGTHYLQVALNDASAVQAAAFKFTRRSSADNDHVTQWGVYGTNDAEAEKGACEHLTEILTPFASKTETLTTSGFETKGYKYLRFYIDDTYMSTGAESRGYGHVSEFQLYPATVETNPTSQKTMMGELATNLEAAIAAVPADEDEITVEHYAMLKEAYDAFMERYVNPADLRAAIASAEAVIPTIVEGTTPGYWNAGATDALTAKIGEATAYDKAGVYTPGKSQDMIDALTQTTKEMMASAHNIEPGKWYRFRFASEEMYEQYGWGTGNVLDESTQGNLFDQYVNIALRNAPEGGEVSIEPIFADEMREGDALYFCNDIDEDASLFRFVPLAGDTVYAIQNKATGLYINCAGANSNNVTMSLNPTTFRVSAIGYGEVLISGINLDGVSSTNLHAQLATHRLVTWEASDLGSNSGLMIEPVDDVTGDPDRRLTREVIPGKIYAQCYPVSLSVSDGGMYTVAGTFTKDEKHYIALNTIDGAAAGEPFIYINGETSDFVEPAEGEEVMTETITLTVGDDIVKEAGMVNGLRGTFAYQWVDTGTTIFLDNRAEGATGEEGTDCTRDVSGNTAFLDFGSNTVDADGNYSLVIEVGGEINTDAIENVVNKVAKAGRIYTIDGKLVRENGTINDVKSMGKGVYILNGVKVSVSK